MNINLLFTRILFAIITVFFMVTYMTTTHLSASNVTLGLLFGIVFFGALIAAEILFRRFNMRTFNTAVLGLFVGYLMGQALILFYNTILGVSHIATSTGADFIRMALFLFGTYLGTMMTMRASDEFYLSIPFVRFSSVAHKKKDLLVDISVLSDTRMLDICATGIFDNHLTVPRFVVNELYAQSESGEEKEKSAARKALEVLRKMQDMPNLGLRFDETNFPKMSDMTAKMVRLARYLDANVLTADISRVQMSSFEGVRVVNIHSLSNSLKPLMEAGETMNVKIQRFGKEHRQGVGYLDDGTMVVVNGGGDFVGEHIPTKVLSVKHTASGRIVFCNVTEDDREESLGSLELEPKHD